MLQYYLVLGPLAYIIYKVYFTSDETFRSDTYSFKPSKQLLDRKRDWENFDEEKLDYEKIKKERLQRQDHLGTLKIILTTYQLILQSRGTFNVQYPPKFSSFLDTLGVLNLDLGGEYLVFGICRSDV